MFRDFRGGGYNLEDINVTVTHLISLVLLIAIVYTCAALQGEAIKQKGVQNYIGRVKEPGRVAPRHSLYIGLQGQSWGQFINDFSDIIDELLLLSPHIRPYYKKGRRAMKLIGSVF
jgi:hypothetical protein